MKALPHAAHWKGFSRVWIRRCFSGDELRPNALPHSVQPKGFPTASGVEGAKPLGMLSLRMPSRRAPSSLGGSCGGEPRAGPRLTEARGSHRPGPKARAGPARSAQALVLPASTCPQRRGPTRRSSQVPARPPRPALCLPQ